MKINFIGATRTVTGSQHLLEVNGSRLLLECGLFQGRRKDTYERNQNFVFDPKSIDAVILSHAHIDHSGNLPNLVKNGYSGPIYASSPTSQLCDIMLRDSAYIHESDAAYVNKKRAKRGEPPIEPLYTQADSARAIDLFEPVAYDTEFEPANGVTAWLVDAGHILGAAGVVLDIKENGRKFRVWFSGDIGRVGQPLLQDPVLPDAVDHLIMECTYGDKPHHLHEEAYDELCEVVGRTLGRGGKVIIPAFAVGRTQDLVYSLNRMVTLGFIPSVPVFVDSPLAVNASDIFRKNSNLFDDETREFVEQGRHPALTFDKLVYTRSVDESKAINEMDEPMVIISASGMAENGRILHHLKNNIEDPKNTVIIVSWNAPYTLGRRLAERAKTVKIFGETYRRGAEVATIGGFSAHAGQVQLLRYAQSTRSSLKQVFLVHGEEKPAAALTEVMKGVGIRSIAYPGFRDIVEI